MVFTSRNIVLSSLRKYNNESLFRYRSLKK